MTEDKDKGPGTGRIRPDVETTLLAEESPVRKGERLGRALTLFDVRIGGKPTSITPEIFTTGEAQWLEVIGVVGTLAGKEGLFGQCGWFGNHDLDWYWVRLTGIESMEVRRDSRFRGGELCMWLRTPHADYAMILPHKTFVDSWEETLDAFGQMGRAAKVKMWPACGQRPKWWKAYWRDAWPFDKSPKLKRRPSITTDDEEAVSDGPNQRRRLSGGTVRWLRFGRRGNEYHRDESQTLLQIRQAWKLAPDASQLEPQQPGRHGLELDHASSG